MLFGILFGKKLMGDKSGKDFIGKSYGNLTVVDTIRFDKSLLFITKCSICSLDPQLYGDGTFVSEKSSVTRGHKPCGCSRNYKKSAYQTEVLLRRKLQNTSHEFVDFVGRFQSVSDKVEVKCNYSGLTWDTTSVAGILKALETGRAGCPYCKSKDAAVRCTQPTSNIVKRFMNTGKYDTGTKFFRGNENNQWYYYCPICAKDEFTEAGLCDGVFESTNSKLNAGVKSCRCSPTNTFTKGQREYTISKLTEGSCYKFLGWSNGYKNTKSKILIECESHGNFEVSLARFLSGVRCSSCSKGAFSRLSETAILYIIRVEGMSQSFTGFGITSKFENRIRQHKCELRKSGLYIEEISTFCLSGNDAFLIETKIKQSFDLRNTGVRGFIKEACAYQDYSSLVDFVTEKTSKLGY